MVSTDKTGVSSSRGEKVLGARLLEEVDFENSFVDKLPADPEEEIYVRPVRGAAYSRVNPTPPWVDDQSEYLGKKKTSSESSLEMVAWSSSCARLLGIEESSKESTRTISVLAGAEVTPSMKPYAQCYGGHQFGSWADQLGDGRVINLGEVVNGKGEKYEIQLKGAGKTPYSRSADGRAVMRSSVREFLCSEAMYHLGIPTTRALSLVATGAGVVRDQFYDGQVQVEPGAVVCRVAENFVRLGSFQLPAYRNDLDLLKKIANYTIDRSFPQFSSVTDDFDDEENRYVLFLREVISRTVKMIVKWQAVGFVHGVCNTDNFSVLGVTIDYGPYGFLDSYDPSYTPNTTDLPGRRYCYGRQPSIGLWNLTRFAEALVPLIGVRGAEAELERYQTLFVDETESSMQRKLGLLSWTSADDKLVQSFLDQMREDKLDYTNMWRALSSISTASKDEADDETVLKPLEWELKKVQEDDKRQKWVDWVRSYAARLSEDKDRDGNGWSEEERVTAMNKVNPKYILRNYLAQNAIEKAENGDYNELLKLLEVLQRPYDEQPENSIYTEEPPQWASRRGVCVNSCSS
ncbi:hypothetical protein NDN08_001340 [Rhodosorus marinus]|uniref:Selenoprotein O n=1 Tax=Rhodosorus marinus TaxID=101924 RepID=A0AAV8UWC1_9RHOD|nr:hypothetical protein NDN08_001340 [Rhodosorus marinus]